MMSSVYAAILAGLRALRGRFSRAMDGPGARTEAGSGPCSRTDGPARASLAHLSHRTHRTRPLAGIWRPFIDLCNPKLDFPSRVGAVPQRRATANQSRASAFSPPPPFGEACQTRGAGPQRPAARQSQTLAAAAPDDSPILVLGPGGLFVTEWTPIRPISPILGATHAQAE